MKCFFAPGWQSGNARAWKENFLLVPQERGDQVVPSKLVAERPPEFR